MLAIRIEPVSSTCTRTRRRLVLSSGDPRSRDPNDSEPAPERLTVTRGSPAVPMALPCAAPSVTFGSDGSPVGHHSAHLLAVAASAERKGGGLGKGVSGMVDLGG